MEIDEQAYEGI